MIDASTLTITPTIQLLLNDGFQRGSDNHIGNMKIISFLICSIPHLSYWRRCIWSKYLTEIRIISSTSLLITFQQLESQAW